MDYSKLEKLRENEKNLKLFAKKIGMTEQGVTSMLLNRTITVERLEHICMIYRVPIVSFFTADDNELHEPSNDYAAAKEQLDKTVEMLLEMLREKDEEIARLNRELGRRGNEKKTGVA